MLIAIEGIRGCGKTTIINNLKHQLERIGNVVKVYTFPDISAPHGTFIYHHDRNMEHKYEYGSGYASETVTYDILNAYAANRKYHKDSINSDLTMGYVVLCDTYILSGIVRHIPSNAEGKRLSAWYNVLRYFDKDLPKPDVTYLIYSGHWLDHKLSNRIPSDEFLLMKKIVPFYSKRFVILLNHFDKGKPFDQQNLTDRFSDLLNTIMYDIKKSMQYRTHYYLRL